MNFAVEEEDKFIIVKPLLEVINAEVANEFKIKVLGFISEKKCSLALNFSEVDFIDSSGLGSLVVILKTLDSLHKKLVIFQINNKIQSLFKLTRLDKVFIITSNQEEAIKYLKKSG